MLYILVCFFNLNAEYIMWNARLNEAQAGIKIAGRNINNLRYANVNHSNGSKWRETKESVDVGERGKWKSFLKLNIKKKKTKQKTKIMAYDPIISFQVEKVYAVTYVIFLGSKIIVDGDCSHEIKRHLLLGRKAMKT